MLLLSQLININLPTLRSVLQSLIPQLLLQTAEIVLLHSPPISQTCLLIVLGMQFAQFVDLEFILFS